MTHTEQISKKRTFAMLKNCIKSVEKHSYIRIPVFSSFLIKKRNGGVSLKLFHGRSVDKSVSESI